MNFNNYPITRPTFIKALCSEISDFVIWLKSVWMLQFFFSDFFFYHFIELFIEKCVNVHFKIISLKTSKIHSGNFKTG